jgi:deoxyhypusine synthase
MSACGVLGAGSVGKAAEIIAEMFNDPNCTVFLTIAGALVPGGLRNIIRELIDKEYVNVVITTGANIVHDLIEALGYRHSIGTFKAEDTNLKTQKVGRIGNIYVEQSIFRNLEKWIYELLKNIPLEKRMRISGTNLLYEMGKRIRDPESILATSAKKGVPIICPAFLDSIVGFQLWMFSQDERIILDPLLDVNELMEKVFEAQKTGIIILGGGCPKHFALFANTFREGVDYAVQITMDRAEPGGLSGAPLSEAISWNKVKPDGKIENVICDVTIVFPLLVIAALEKLEKAQL